MVDLIYSRNAANKPLDYGEIAKRAPAVFASSPIETVTDKYQHVSTYDVMQTLKFEGWLPVQAAQSSPIKGSFANKWHQRHLVAFARESDMDKPEGRPEIVLYNSSDKSSSLKLYDGFFRWICSNSLVAGSGEYTKLRHLKSRMYNFTEILQGAIYRASGMSERVERLQDTTIDYHQARDLVEKALTARWDNYETTISNMENPSDPLPKGTFWNFSAVDQLMYDCPRGVDDPFYSNRDVNLWQVFNRSQEYLLRGGLDLVSVSEKRGVSLRKARPIGDPKKAVSINTALWETFESVAA